MSVEPSAEQIAWFTKRLNLSEDTVRKVIVTMHSINQTVSIGGSWESLHVLPYMNLLGRLIEDSEKPKGEGGQKGISVEDIEMETVGRDWKKTRKLLSFWQRKGIVKINDGSVYFAKKFKPIAKEKD